MGEDTTTPESGATLKRSATVPVLLLAYSPFDNEKTEDRWALKEDLVLGRKYPSNLRIDDEWLSTRHFCIFREGEAFYVEDLKSTNGTFLNGFPLVGRQKLVDSAIVRAGRSIFVFHEDREELLEPYPRYTYKIGGRFHVAPLIDKIRRFSNSNSHVLLAGPSGSGKELAAHALAEMSGREIIIQNASRFRSEDMAAMSLFGVASKAFTDVDGRAGLIELADGKTLFLDEAHALPQGVQRTLLRVLEDRSVTRSCDTTERRVDVRFILASNQVFTMDYGIESDLLARMRVLKMSSLKERVADIPSIFRCVLKQKLVNFDFKPEPILDRLFADHYECLCLDDYEKENTRRLLKIADDIVSELINGKPTDDAIKKVFERRYNKDIVLTRQWGAFYKNDSGKTNSPKSSKQISDIDMMSEMAKIRTDADTLALIREAYYNQRGVVKDIIEHLKSEHNITTSHRRITKIIDAMGLPRLKRKRL